MTSTPNWRIRPDAATAHAVEQIALRENRSLANAVLILLREALRALGVRQTIALISLLRRSAALPARHE